MPISELISFKILDFSYFLIFIVLKLNCLLKKLFYDIIKEFILIISNTIF